MPDMNENITRLIDRYRRMRNRKMLAGTHKGCYAFIGVGGHALNNLYPVAMHLGIRLKYICCRSADKLPLIRRRFGDVRATTSISDIIGDAEVDGVFVSASPSAHFDIAKEVLSGGKSLFIEKPPCRSADELGQLVEAAKQGNAKAVMAGLQKRYSPITRLLSKNIGSDEGITYNMKYLTGPYPEGDVLTELFIHPLDYVCFIFGEAEISGINACRRTDGGITLQLLLRHDGAAGIAELSTAYTWTDAAESLTVNTHKGCFTMNNMETLTFRPNRGTLLGIPLEKVFNKDRQLTTLFGRNNFVPALPDNQLYSQGFYNEIKAFADAVERGRRQTPYQIETLGATFRLIDDLKRRLRQ